MNKLSINLLPPELLVHEKDQGKKTLQTKLSISILAVMVLITSVILMARIIQRKNVSDLHKVIEEDTARVNSFKQQEQLVMGLKARLLTVNSLAREQDSAVGQNYTLLTALVPSTAQVVEIDLGKANTVALSVNLPDTNFMDQFFDNLTSKEKNQNKIAKISLDSLGRRLDAYQADLTITMK